MPYFGKSNEFVTILKYESLHIKSELRGKS